MNITVKAKPKSKKPTIRQLDATHFIVAVTEPPIDGRANYAIQVALAKYLGIKRSDIRLVQGETHREKIFTVSLSPEQLEMVFQEKTPQKKLF